MKSTGEVMGIDSNFETAFYKSQSAAGISLPENGQIFLSVKDSDKAELLSIASKLVSLGFKLILTEVVDLTSSINLIIFWVWKLLFG